MESSRADEVITPKFWAPLMLGGYALGPCLRFLRRHFFRLHWRCWPMLPVALSLSALQSALGLAARLRHGRAVARTELAGAPIFVLGHWRTGTTLLHDLLALDERFAAPTFYPCSCPTHFFLTEKWVKRWLSGDRPRRRRQDNMLASLSSPGEDEFALGNLGAGSPYEEMLLPGVPELAGEYVDLIDLPPHLRHRWKRALLGFLRALTFHHRRQLVLKSPLHTARVRTLLEMFPDAKFVNIVRDPRAVYSSTMQMGRLFASLFSLQRLRMEGTSARVIGRYLKLHRRLAEVRPLIPSGNFSELRYEELVRNPVGQIRRVYEELGLGGFEAARPKIEEYFAQRKGYQTNRHELSGEELAVVEAALEEIITQTGYR